MIFHVELWKLGGGSHPPLAGLFAAGRGRAAIRAAPSWESCLKLIPAWLQVGGKLGGFHHIRQVYLNPQYISVLSYPAGLPEPETCRFNHQGRVADDFRAVTKGC